MWEECTAVHFSKDHRFRLVCVSIKIRKLNQGLISRLRLVLGMIHSDYQNRNGILLRCSINSPRVVSSLCGITPRTMIMM